MTLLERALHPLSLATGGLLIWVLHFSLAYGVNALACEGRLPAPLPGVPVIVLGAGAAALLLLLLLGGYAWRSMAGPADHAARFLAAFAFGSALLAAMAILWQSLPVLLIDSCVRAGG